MAFAKPVIGTIVPAPAYFASFSYKCRQVSRAPRNTIVMAVAGYLCIRLLKMIADRGRFGAFAYYCWTVGALVLIFTIV